MQSYTLHLNHLYYLAPIRKYFGATWRWDVEGELVDGLDLYIQVRAKAHLKCPDCALARWSIPLGQGMPARDRAGTVPHLGKGGGPLDWGGPGREEGRRGGLEGRKIEII